MSKKYNLSNAQLIKLTRLCNQEQGTVTGCRAEASLMANLFERKGSSYGTGANGLYNYVRNSRWFSEAPKWMDYGTYNSKQLEAVKDVLVNGNRFFDKDNIDEHDCISDIKVAKNNGVPIDKWDRSQYKSGVTIIENEYESTWVFVCFPDAYSDPFGTTDISDKTYTSCIEIPLSEVSFGCEGKDVLICQKMLRMGVFRGSDGKLLKLNGKCDANTVYAIKQAQKKFGLAVDGICGKNTWKALFDK